VLEASLDIEMVISMAPGISQLRVYEGTDQHDVFNRIATDNLAKQISSSYVQGPATDPMTDQIFIQFAMQGQSCFVASGDGGALSSVAGYPLTSPYVTLVGGTVLTNSGPGGSWVSETAWSGSQGGVSFTDQIPWWQKGVDFSGNQGSTTMRNVPDVALTASGVYAIANKGTNAGPVGGTSCAAPLWAGFMALVNQQAAAVGKPPPGFINPAIYAIGSSPFHDITTGNNTNAASPGKFFAVAGYDLCTGWGTPNGSSLINALVGFTGAVWVEFGNSDPGNGTYTRPYNTLAQGTNAVPSGGTIAIKGPGSTLEIMAISKPMTLQAVGGPATIGH
jgi:subtilase family serine protease